jgi:hypothetical protein
MSRIVQAFVIACLLAGCATTKVMDGIMSSWAGATIEDVVAQWGYPHEERQFGGKKLYVWNHNKSATLPSTTHTTGQVNQYGQFSANSTTTGGQTFHGSCQRILEVDEAGSVVRWQWQGNNCPFIEAMEYRHWRKKV